MSADTRSRSATERARRVATAVWPSRRHDAGRSRFRPLLGVVTAGALVASVTITASASTPAAEPLVPLRMLSGWVPYWNGDRAPNGIVSMGSLSNAISPFAYEVRDADRIESRGTDELNARMRQASINARLPFVPTMFDTTDDGKMRAILLDPARRAQHVNALMDTVLRDGLDGIDLDYENFAFEDSYDTWATTEVAWTQFVQELGTALHRYAKLLYVSIPSVRDNNRTRTSGYWVYNPVGIEPFVDRIRFMAYSYSWNSPGPNAPLEYTARILQWVTENLPPSKVELGVPLYGRVWITGVQGTCPAGVRLRGRTPMRTERAIALAAEMGVVPERFPDGEMRFSYTATYTGPPAPPGDDLDDPGDGDEFGPMSSVPLAPAGRVFVPPADDVVWPFPVDEDPPPTTKPPTTTDPPGGGGNGGGGGGGTSPPTTEPPVTYPPPPGGPSVTCTINHTVYYPDAGSSLLKLQQAIDAGLGGITFFAIGYEEVGHFDALRETLLNVPHAPGADPFGEFTFASPEPGRVKVEGWALDPEASLPIIVRISVDGEVRKQVLANREVPEVLALYPLNGAFHGVDTTLRVDPGQHRVCVQAIGLGAGNTLRWIDCATVTVDAPA